MELELYRFTCGAFQAPVTFFLDDGRSDFIKVPVPAYLIRHPKYGLAVFDTGLGHRFKLAIGETLGVDRIGFDFREGEDFPARVRAAGFEPDSVRWVINSHLHADHCGGNAGFPNATVVLQRREREAAYTLENERTYKQVDFDTGQPFLLIDGEHDLFGDGSLVLLPTFGHTAGHQSARLRLESGDVVLTADCCYMAGNLQAHRVPASNFDREASLAVLERLRMIQSKGTRLLFGHDPRQWRDAMEGERFR